MEIKQVLKSGIKYSLIFSLLTLLEQVIGIVAGSNSIILTTFPIYTLLFILTVIWSHKKYIIEKEDAFISILSLTIIFIFFSYYFEYLIKIVFYFSNENNVVDTEKKQGILGLLTAFDKPTFNPISNLLTGPFQLLKYHLINFDFLNFCLTLFSSKLIVASIIIYFESLFYLYKKFEKKGWNSIIPIQNNLILLSISQKPKWWIILLYIPFLKRIMLFFINKSIAHKFNKSNLFSLGMTLLPPFFYGEIGLNNINERK